MITGDQLLAHLAGDYLLQSHWMATEKTKRHVAALAHVIAYAIPFLILKASWPALFVIISTHFLIDRYRLARYVVFAKNFLAPRSFIRTVIDDLEFDEYGRLIREVSHDESVKYWPVWADAKATGYPSDVPPWLSVWLLILADNTLHILINGLALTYL